MRLLGALTAILAGIAMLSFVAAVMVRLTPSVAAQRLASYTGRLNPEMIGEQEDTRPQGFGKRVVAPILSGIGKRIARLSPRGYTEHVQKLLLLMGPPYRLHLAGFLGMQFAFAVLLVVPFLWWAVVTSPASPFMWVLSVSVALAMGIYSPYFWLARRVTRRRRALLRALPATLDFMAINVEAGMGFDAALTEVVRRWHNPLTSEFALLLIDFQIGKPRKEAWRDLIQRTQLPDLTSFITAMLQNEQVGSSITSLLRTQAEHMRVRRRQRAEEAARVAPVKMLLPLVFFIFPGILVVLLGPAIPQFIDAFATVGK
jgi:tight adherence protein C